MKLHPLLVLIAAAFPGIASAQEQAKTKVLVLPYQSIYRSVPQQKLDSATALLVKELGARDGLEIVRGAVSAANVAGPDIAGAKAAGEAADKAEAERRIEDAIAERKKAVEAYEKNAGALEEIDPYIDSIHLRARAYMLAGRDKEAKETIDLAARVAPTFELDPARYSRLYRKWFADASKQALEEPRGKLRIASVLPGALIELDGRVMDVAPVLIDGIVPGRHLITARIEGVAPFSTTVQVTAGKETEATASFSETMGGSSVGKVTDAVAVNRIPTEAIQSAAQAGKETGAEWVVFGAMAKDDDRFRVHTFLVSMSKAQLAALDELNFDLEMLTAESDVLRIAQSTHAAIDNFQGGHSKLPVIEKRAREQSTMNTVDGSPELPDSATAMAKKKGKKKDDRRPVFRPLKGGSIVIKDEEEE